MTHADIDIRYLNPEIEKLTYVAGKSDWIDLRAAKDVSLKKGDFALIPLGIAVRYHLDTKHMLHQEVLHLSCYLLSRYGLNL